MAHARLIAHLVQNGWDAPIELELPVSGHTTTTNWPIQDGNHRLFAAIYRLDDEIETVISGSIDLAEELFDLEVTIVA